MDIVRLTFENIKSCDLKASVAIYLQNNGRKYRACIFNNDKSAYYINVTQDRISLQEIKEKCPILKECDDLKTLEGGEVPKGWNVVYMGHGKHLLLTLDVYNKIINTFGKLNMCDVYKNGKRMLLSVL